MTIDTAGYNGVVQLSESLVTRLVATQAYEAHLVRNGGRVTDGDFVGPLVIDNAGVQIHLYLLLGRIGCRMQGHDGANRVKLEAPLYAIGVYSDTNGTIAPVPLALNGLSFALHVSDVAVVQTDAGVHVDFSHVVADSIAIHSILVTTPSTHVGGVHSNIGAMSDAALEQLLASFNVHIQARALRTEIAARVAAGVLSGSDIALNPGGPSSALQRADLFTFDADVDGDGDRSDGGVQLMLFAPDGAGRGVPTDGTDVIPAAASTPPYGWSAHIRADVLSAGIAVFLDNDRFLKQGGVLNTPGARNGYMVVPGSGTRTYSLPSGVDNITVHAPSSGRVQVVASPGAFTPHARVRMAVLGHSEVVSFEAGEDGSADVSIAARDSDRLAFTIDAISLPGDAATVIWRPDITFIDGGLRFDFHFYRYIDNWCDAEGDGFIEVSLHADRTNAFRLRADVEDSGFDAPWWAYVLAWFTGEFGFGLVNSIISEVLVATVVRDAIRDEVNPAAQANTLLQEVNRFVGAPTVPNTALFLDDAECSEDGIALSGRADAGRVVAYGRKTVDASAGVLTIGSPTLVPGVASPYVTFDWPSAALFFSPVIVTSRAAAKVIVDDAPRRFWNDTMDDLFAEVLSRSTRTMVIPPTGAVMFIVAGDGAYVKILLERSFTSAITATWIAFQQRVVESARLVNHIARHIVSSAESMTLTRESYAYSGRISLDRTKFFLTDDTLAAGQERWFWDGVQVTTDRLTLPGGSVTWDQHARELIVELDQSGLDDPDTPFSHQVRFEGTDVFGRTQVLELTIATPASFVRPTRIARTGREGLDDPLGPWINPVRDRVSRPATNPIDLRGSAATILLQGLKVARIDGKATLGTQDLQDVLDALQEGL